jgi:hypothetical protein
MCFRLRNQSEARYALMIGYWYESIFLIILNITYPMKKKRASM